MSLTESQRETEARAGGAQQAGGSPAAAPPSGPGHRRLTGPQRIERWFEVVTAVMLGVVAVATAWSGYQAARWSGEQSADYARAGALRVEATRASTLGGQLRLYDLTMVNSWMAAYVEGETELARLFERRFRPEFRPTFQAWLALDPFNNPNAPPGPLFMPQYASSAADDATRLEAEATRAFEHGQQANEQGDAYVLNTVFLAMVLFLTAIADRFAWNLLRAIILAFALAMLMYGLFNLTVYPII